MLEKPKFLQGVFSFSGSGLDAPAPFEPALTYRVPFDKRAQLVYFRAGNSTAELIYVLLVRDGKPMRYFPLGALASIHVPLAVVEDLHPDTVIELQLAAPVNLRGSIVLDVGMVEF